MIAIAFALWVPPKDHVIYYWPIRAADRWLCVSWMTRTMRAGGRAFGSDGIWMRLVRADSAPRSEACKLRGVKSIDVMVREEICVPRSSNST